VVFRQVSQGQRLAFPHQSRNLQPQDKIKFATCLDMRRVWDVGLSTSYEETESYP
jgi:hypothetical protein